MVKNVGGEREREKEEGGEGLKRWSAVETDAGEG